MKKIFSLFVISLLALVLVACNGGGSSTKELKLAHLSQDKQGIYYGKNDQSIEIKESSVVVDNEEMSIWTYDDKSYLVKVNEGDATVEVEVKFEGKDVTAGEYGKFTKRTLGTAKEDEQGVYLSLSVTDSGSRVILRQSKLTLPDGKEYLLFEDEQGLYIVKDGVVNYVKLSTVLTVKNLEISGKSYALTSLPVPSEGGELTKLVKSIIENIENAAFEDFAVEATLTASAKQTVLTGKKSSSFDLIGTLLSDLSISATASANVKDFDLNDTSKLLAEIKLNASLKYSGMENNVRFQYNAQDGKLYGINVEGDGEPEYFIEDIPQITDATGMIEISDLDLTELFNEVANVEEQLASVGFSYSDIQGLLNNVFALSDKEIKINITKSNAIAALAGAKLLVNTKIDDVLPVVWEEFGEEEKTQYGSYDAFKATTVEGINAALTEAEQFVNALTINSFKLEMNFETFATLIDIDLVIPGEESSENEDGEKEVTCTYNTAIKVNLTINKVESKEIQKVNPADYVIDYSEISAFVKEYLPDVTLPKITSDAEYKKNVHVGEEMTTVNITFSKVSEAEANALREAFLGDESEYSSVYEIDDDFIKEYFFSSNRMLDANGNLLGYNCYISIEISENDLPVITTRADDGITLSFQCEANGKVYAKNGVISGTVEWEDEDKVVYVLVNDEIMDIITYSGDSLSVIVDADTTLVFELDEYDPDLITVNIMCSHYAVSVSGPQYVKIGETATYTVSIEEDPNVEIDQLYLYSYNDGITLIQSGLVDGSTFEVTPQEDDYYITLFLTEYEMNAEE